ncbi:hypothetical protein KFL_002890030 [Klebsormidium nitens]|uniref:BZIP domain-containing protein n=1 Tax=Klebsormidium nitens TaxID=105231 RepID=A0A1Y1ICJ6_KLENI|nr:hypothetical protein KFL_002890030 [Klebsormidium nitens]|eukprot:GAQ86436.1 hypothetical protein KFL_002890030 [Klebsormidium nitens]
MTGPFRPLFGPFCTDILAERATNAPEAGQKELLSNSILCPKARYKVAQKQLVEADKPAKPAEENPRLEMAHSQSSGDEQSEKEQEVPAAFSSPADSEAAEEKMDATLEGATQKQDDPAVCGKAQVELSLVMGFADSLSGFLRSNFSEQSLQAAGAVKPVPQNADSMQALLAGLNESLPAFPAGTSVPAADPLATDNSGAVDFLSAFPLQTTQSDSLPMFRDFFSQQNSQPSPTGVADHRFFQPQAQKSKLVPRRAEPSGPSCSEKRKAEWEDPGNAGAPEESEDMETDGEKGSSDKACNGRKSPRCMSRTEEQRMKDRAKAKRHRQRKKVQEASDKANICHLEAEVERLRKALKASEDAQGENQKVVGTLEKEVELWKTAYRDLGKTMSDMLKVGGNGVAAKAASS